ncbi:hypothetical protein Salat_0143700 [Sesamum alatum]|uniref:Uncharacterized protein n=1 Tax=Sesamum alatum TaxID=300844 RepID=A0AAE2CXB3_9LAMI|nr:hypothetical protein Salat_0143700 [Sesamum alatum]
MDRLYDELDEVKIEVEKLREECRAKNELSESLRKAQVEQLAKIQQAKLEIDRLAQELNAKSMEIREIRKMYEELQCSLHRKDLFLQQISSANEKRQAEFGEKILKLEGENRDLALALDEASVRIQDMEKKLCASSEEIAGLKRLLLIKPEKSFEMQKNELKDLKERDQYMLKLEEESRITQDQLKWKSEQFSHLEEAHQKLQTQFHESKVEWQKEKFSLVDEISSLQATLDAQVRVSESLETQLRMSNQALAHEESRRKVLEIQLSESRSQFENVFLECEAAKTEIDQLTMKRDEEIAELRSLVRKNEILAKEMKYRTAQLEQENSDLLESLKNNQEAQLNNNATLSSLKQLRNKLQGLEKMHNKCAINLKEKEVEWNSQIDKLKGDLDCCLSELDEKNKSMRELHTELEDSRCLLEVKNDEIFALIMVLKSEFYVAYSKLYEAKEKLEMGIEQIEEKNLLLNQQLQSKNMELLKVHAELKHRSDDIAVLMERVQSLDSLKQKDNLMEEELRRYKTMLDESNERQLRLQQQVLELETTQRENIKNALDSVTLELVSRTSEAEEYKLELGKWKSEAERLKLSLEENQQAHAQEKTNLLVIVKDKDTEIGELHEQISMLESAILAKSEAAEMVHQEKDNYMRLAADRNCSIQSLQNEIAQLKKELAEREAGNSALLDAHNTLEQEYESLSFNTKEKDRKIHELQNELESLDQGLKKAEGQKILEIEEKTQIIANLEKELNTLHKEVEFQGKSLTESKQVALQLAASLRTQKSEMQEVQSQHGKEIRYFESLLKELESHKQALLEDLEKASIDREALLAQLEGLCGQIGVFCGEDDELMRMLGKMSHLSEEVGEPTRNLLANGLDDAAAFSSSRKSIQVAIDERTPLTELNC